MKWNAARLALALRRGRLALTAFVVMAVGGGFSTAQAQVSCGDTITTDTQLGGDLTCPSGTNPALTVVGPAELNLNGFTVTCEGDSDDGIVLEGAGAALQKGTVTMCSRGVLLEGDGGHSVSRVVAVLNGDTGFQVQSNDNLLVRNTADDNDSDGISVGGDNNRIVKNEVLGNEEGGITVSADNNQIVNNEVVDNDFDGIRVSGADNTRVIANTITGNDGAGIFVLGPDNHIGANTVTDNRDEGIEIDGDRNKILGNLSEDNGEQGITLREGAEDNVVRGNRAFGNGGSDLFDNNVDCDNNKWKANRFDVANQACIQ